MELAYASEIKHYYSQLFLILFYILNSLHRYKVALGVALALRYLHEDAEQSVLHRDIKNNCE